MAFALTQRSRPRVGALAVLYLAAVSAVTVAHFALAWPSVHVFALTPTLFAHGQLWLLATSAFLVSSGSLLGALVSLVPLGAAIALLRDSRRFWRAAIAGHLGSTVIAYAAIGALWLADPGTVGGLVDQPDYGISCVWAGAIGAIAAATRRSPSRAIRLVGPIVPVSLLIVLTATSTGLARLEHPLAFLLGWGVASLPTRREAVAA
jgi:hypothetical protein